MKKRSPPVRAMIGALAVLLLSSSELRATLSCSVTQWTVTTSPAFAGYSQPYDMITADFDGDGKLDFAAITDAFVLVYYGTGNGYIRSSHSYAAQGASSFRALAVADVNNDGAPDLVVTDYGTGNLVVFLNDKAGGFSTPVPIATTFFPYALAAGDFDGDGFVDVAATSWEHKTVHILRGDGTGHFAESGTVDLPSIEAMKIVSGDFDGDGRTDLAFTHYVSNIVDVLYGRGDGTFGAAVQAQVGYYPDRAIVVVDLDGDHHADIVTANWDDNSVTVARNVDGRSFAAPVAYPIGESAVDVTVADFNGDGIPDIIAADPSLHVCTGRGDGTFNDAFTVQLQDQYGAVYPQMMRAGDFNGDGIVDGVIWDWSFAIAINRCGYAVISAGATPPLITSGQQAQISAAVHGVGALPPVATGTVIFSDGDTVVGSGTLKQGVVNTTVTLTGAGTHTVVVAYQGDANYNPVSTTVTQRVTLDTTSVAVTLSPAQPKAGDTIVPTITVTSSTGGQPTGTVSLVVDNVYLGSASLSTLLPFTIEATGGAHTLVARYSGDTNFPPSSTTMTFTVAKLTPTVTLPQSTVGVAGTAGIQVLVTPPVGSGLYPTGTVTLTIDGTPTTLAAPNPTFLVNLPAGLHYMQASYSGNDDLTPVSSPVVTRNVVPAATMVLDARGSATGITVSWTGIVGATAYDVIVRTGVTNGGTVYPAPMSGQMTFTNLYPGMTYVFYARARNGFTTLATSNSDVAMLTSFSRDPLMPGMTVTADDFTSTAAQVNALRAQAGLRAITTSVSAGAPILAGDLQQLRTALDEARLVFGAPPVAYSSPSLSPQSTTIRAADFQEIREGSR